MHRLLKRLNRQTKINLIRRHILPNRRQIRRLNTIQKHQKRRNLIISPSLRLTQHRIILLIRPQVNLLRHPKIIHSLPIPLTNPPILHIIKIIQIRSIPINHPPLPHINIPQRIKQRLLPQTLHPNSPNLLFYFSFS